VVFKETSKQNATDDWLTPPALVRYLGEFDLDPCASVYQKTMLARENYVWPEVNGLMEPWSGRVWCNPPFSECRRWINRFFLHGNGILLVPAWTGNSWFRPIWEHADALYFSNRGINFICGNDPSKDGKSMFGICLAAAGPENVKALPAARYHIKGAFVTKPVAFSY
jgi:hypothetical protein